MRRPHWEEPQETEFISRLITVICASLLVEAIRITLHPESSQKAVWLVVAVFANLAYHIWNMPKDLPRTAVSAVLGEASLPAVLLLISALVGTMAVAALNFLKDFFPKV